MSKPTRPGAVLRCAIYTRKSSEEGLEQDFNSLQAQREACEAYIRSQTHEGWTALPAHYDDGGYSGGTLQRPALEKLLADIRAKKVNIVVVYKIDRLTRSLLDFAKIIEVFDDAGVSFVSVTQQFNTTTSMGRLTLNVLLSFAQFEREVTGERIRDKIAASKKKGMWMGGRVPLGYEVKERKLQIEEAEARIIRRLFDLYLKHGNVRVVKEEFDFHRPVTISGRGSSFSRGHIYKVLSNPIYAGLVSHKGEEFDGQHASIIPIKIWNLVQQQLEDHAVRVRSDNRPKEPSPLAALLFDETGDRLTPSHAVKRGRRYRYYVASRLIRESKNAGGARLPALQVEAAVVGIILDLLGNQQRLFEVLDENLADSGNAKESLAAALHRRDELQKISAHEQLVRLKPALEQIVISDNEMKLRIRPARLKALIAGKVAQYSFSGRDREQSTPFEITVPLMLRQRGRETRLILHNVKPASRTIDRTLAGLVTRGYRWRHEVMNGIAPSATMIAEREKLTPAYVSWLMDLSFLGPDILMAIISGEAPVDLSARRLQSIANFPLDWPSQRAVLGFTD